MNSSHAAEVDQFYYCWSTSGLAGVAGFGFRAISPGITPALMRTIEQLGLVSPPVGKGRSASMHRLPFGDGRCALVKTSIIDERDGRYFVHGLVGGARDLDPADLLQLAYYDVWISSDAGLEPQNQTLPRLSLPAPDGPERPAARDTDRAVDTLASFLSTPTISVEGSFHDALSEISALCASLPLDDAARVEVRVGDIASGATGWAKAIGTGRHVRDADRVAGLLSTASAEMPAAWWSAWRCRSGMTARRLADAVAVANGVELELATLVERPPEEAAALLGTPAQLRALVHDAGNRRAAHDLLRPIAQAARTSLDRSLLVPGTDPAFVDEAIVEVARAGEVRIATCLLALRAHWLGTSRFEHERSGWLRDASTVLTLSASDPSTSHPFGSVPGLPVEVALELRAIDPSLVSTDLFATSLQAQPRLAPLVTDELRSAELHELLRTLSEHERSWPALDAIADDVLARGRAAVADLAGAGASAAYLRHLVATRFDRADRQWAADFDTPQHAISALLADTGSLHDLVIELLPEKLPRSMRKTWSTR